MIQDLQKQDSQNHLETDICIVGGGIAGQTVGIALGQTGLDVTLLESGDKDYRQAVQNMMAGENVGHPYYDLIHARLRLFGGQAAIWGGRCAELDEIDFEKRSWVPHSGWPINKADLAPYYQQVFDEFGLPRPAEGGNLWDEIGYAQPPYDPKRLSCGLWVFDGDGERFTNMKRAGLEKIRIILNATVREVEVSENGVVQALKAQSLNQRHLRVKAKIFVLAMGAIETIRLLRLAVPNRPQGLGNGYDLLGRFFMEHPHGRAGEIIPRSLTQALASLPRSVRRKGIRYVAYMRPSPELQKTRGILNTSISLSSARRIGQRPELHRLLMDKATYHLPTKRALRFIWRQSKNIAIRGLEYTAPYSTMLNMKLSGGRSGLFAAIRAEQAPNPDSRVIPAQGCDALGVPHIALDWRLSSLDKESISVLMQELAGEYERLNWGRVEPSLWLSDPDIDWMVDPLIDYHPVGGYHHMGGTRMGLNRKTGVVNKQCRLFESSNLYIASSSVFPTSGWANPTVTIMALALRLGKHIQTRFNGKRIHEII